MTFKFSLTTEDRYMRHLPPTPDKGDFVISVIGGMEGRARGRV